MLYQYGDPSRGGAGYAHIAIVTERPDLVLDSRVGLGVGTRAHVQGAVRRYRRVFTDAQLRQATTESDEAMWKERYEEAMARVGELAGQIDLERAKLNAAMPIVARPADSAVKAEHVEYGQAMERWQGHMVAMLEDRDVGLMRIAAQMQALPDALATTPGPQVDTTGQETSP